MNEKKALEILKSPNAKTITEDIILIRNTIAANVYLEAIKKSQILVDVLKEIYLEDHAEDGGCECGHFRDAEKVLAQWEKEK